MLVAFIKNPNVCPGCAQLLDDENPLMVALNGPDTAALAEPAQTGTSKHTFHTLQHILQ